MLSVEVASGSINMPEVIHTNFMEVGDRTSPGDFEDIMEEVGGRSVPGDFQI